MKTLKQLLWLVFILFITVKIGPGILGKMGITEIGTIELTTAVSKEAKIQVPAGLWAVTTTQIYHGKEISKSSSRLCVSTTEAADFGKKTEDEVLGEISHCKTKWSARTHKRFSLTADCEQAGQPTYTYQAEMIFHHRAEENNINFWKIRYPNDEPQKSEEIQVNYSYFDEKCS